MSNSLRVRLVPLFALASSVAFVSCKSVEVQELPENADVNEVISSVQKMKDDARSRNVHLLSPTFYERGDKWLNEAIEERNEGDDARDEVAKARANFAKANEVAKVSESVLGPVMTARQAALAANPSVHANQEFMEADEDLKDAAEEIEENDVGNAREEVRDLQAQYYDVELYALKNRYLSYARDQVEQARGENAKKFAPNTLTSVERGISDMEVYITANRHAEDDINSRVARLNSAADKLVRVTRESRIAGRSHSEDVALELVNKEQEIAMTEAERAALAGQNSQLESELNVRGGAISTLESERARLENERAMLEANRQFNQQFEAVRSMFGTDEAQVFRQGNTLNIRLKGLTFPNGKAVITPDNYALLTKVQEALKSFPESSITIEGHTDDRGSQQLNQRLSEQRALAVEEYLVENGIASEDRVNAVGQGFEDPIASNRTAEGRAQNRRVDIIVEPQTPEFNR